MNMHFDPDKSSYMPKEKSDIRKKERKAAGRIIEEDLKEE